MLPPVTISTKLATIVAVLAIAATACASQTTTPTLVASTSAIQPDPQSGPHVQMDAQHSHDHLSLTPATGLAAPIPLQPKAGTGSSTLGRGAAGPSVAASQKREVFGFAPYWLLGKNTEWDYSVLSTVSYFGLDVNDNGGFANSGPGWTGWNSAELTNIINHAHAAGSRVVVTIKDFRDASINSVVAVPANRQALITGVITAMRAKNLDGVNVDFEGVEDPLFPDLQIGITTLMTEMSSQVHAAFPQAEVSIDTYAGSASWDGGVFKIGDLAPAVDAFVIMAYDSVFSNMPGQAGPNSPLNGWTYNGTADVQQYLTKAPASKIILGVPYYGYRWSTVSGAPYAGIVGNQIAEGYSAAMDDLACGHPSLQRGWDGIGQGPWASWWSPATNDPCGDNFGRPQELYYDDANSLGLKYNLVNNSNIRGAGIWTLGMDSGRTELWGALHTYFSCPVSLLVPAAPTTTEFTLSLSSGTCSVASYDVQQFDVTNNQGWFNLPSGPSTTRVVEGYPGHSYIFSARAHTTAGLTSSWNQVSNAVSSTATYAHPFKGLYTVDAFGGVNAADSPPLAGSAYWSGWKIARAIKAQPGVSPPQNGFVLDGWGGLHPYGPSGLSETSAATSHYWPSWDIARDFAFLPDGTGGLVLDGWGGLHPFRVNGSTAPLVAQTTGYWPGWDIARKVVIFPDASGGYVMDGWGGLHPFSINGAAMASAPTVSAYWTGWTIARDVVLVPSATGRSGYVLDGWGGVHPFHPAADPALPVISPSGYWPGWDIARGLWFMPGSSTAGYTLDGWGGLHPFGSAPAIVNKGYWPGWDIGVGITGG